MFQQLQTEMLAAATTRVGGECSVEDVGANEGSRFEQTNLQGMSGPLLLHAVVLVLALIIVSHGFDLV